MLGIPHHAPEPTPCTPLCTPHHHHPEPTQCTPHHTPLHQQPDPTLAGLGRGRSPARPSQGCGVLIIAGAGAGPRGAGRGAAGREHPLTPGLLHFPQGQEEPGRRRGTAPGPLLGAAGPAQVLKRRRPPAPVAHDAVQRDPGRRQPRAQPRGARHAQGTGAAAALRLSHALGGSGVWLLPSWQEQGVQGPLCHTPAPCGRAGPGGWGGRVRRDRPEPRPGLARIELFLALESVGSGRRPAVTSQLRVKLGQGGWQGGGDPRRAVSPGWGCPGPGVHAGFMPCAGQDVWWPCNPRASPAPHSWESHLF